MAERRTISVKLEADISSYTSSLTKAATATRGFTANAEKSINRDMDSAMKRAGQHQGGVLALGINAGLVRHSPVIAAGVGAALAAGAPAALAGASVLFGGIGAIAAAQNTAVRDSWTNLGHEIRDGAVADAAVLVPVYVNMADKIGAAFQRMRPELRQAFEDVAPQIDTFGDSLTRAAQLALPGLLRAVERGGPVIEGLGSLMESVGQGISDFFDAMSDDNAAAAGKAFDALGDALGAALPLLGELLGTGSEIATVVLPPLAFALETVHDAAAALGPVLPATIAGIAGMKIASGISSGISTLSTNLASFATNSARAGAGAGAAKGLLGGFAGVLGGPVGLAITGVTVGLGALISGLGTSTRVTDEAREAQRGLADALRESEGALDANVRAAAAKAAQDAGLLDVAQDAGLRLSVVTDAVLGNSAAYDQVTAALGRYYEAHTVLDASGLPIFDREAEAASNARISLDELAPTVARNAEWQAQLAAATGGAGGAMAAAGGVMRDFAGEASKADSAVSALQAALDELSGKTVSMLEAQFALEDAIDAASGATKDLTGSVLNAAGGLNAQSEAGRAAGGVLLDVRDKGNALISTMIQQGSTTAQVTAANANLRSSFIAAAGQMGITGGAADRLADQILGIPAERQTRIDAQTAQARADIAGVQGALDALRDRSITITTIRREMAISQQAGRSYTGLQKYAQGGDFRPGIALVGEQGPELVRFNGTGTVIPAPETRQILSGGREVPAMPTFHSREFSGTSMGSPSVNVAAPDLTGLTIQGRVTIDGDGIATIAGQVVDQAFTSVNRSRSARGSR